MILLPTLVDLLQLLKEKCIEQVVSRLRLGVDHPDLLADGDVASGGTHTAYGFDLGTSTRGEQALEVLLRQLENLPWLRRWLDFRLSCLFNLWFGIFLGSNRVFELSEAISLGGNGLGRSISTPSRPFDFFCFSSFLFLRRRTYAFRRGRCCYRSFGLSLALLQLLSCCSLLAGFLAPTTRIFGLLGFGCGRIRCGLFVAVLERMGTLGLVFGFFLSFLLKLLLLQVLCEVVHARISGCSHDTATHS